jgi:hypothetical protein
MKHVMIAAALIWMSCGAAGAQSNLQFNQVRIISANTEVPAGKVWKIEGIWGPTVEECVDMPCSACWGNATKALIVRRSFKIDGVTAYQEIARKIGYGNGVCTSQNTTCGDVCLGSVPYKDNIIFPLWVPEGTFVDGNGTTRVSVVEFNVVP